MASIVYRGKSFHVIYRYKNSEGKTKQKWETYKTEREALARKEEVEYHKQGGWQIPPLVKTVSDLLDGYVSCYGSKEWEFSTYESNLRLIDQHIKPGIGNLAIEKVTPRTIDEYYRHLQASDFTSNPNQSLRLTRKIHKILGSAFTHAVQWGYLSASPCAYVRLRKPQKIETVIWDLENFNRAVALCEDQQLVCAMHLAFSCSMRLGEIAALTWDCLDIKAESIANNDAKVHIYKSQQRVKLSTLDIMHHINVIQTFPPTIKSNSCIIHKTPKTKASNRTVWLPATVCRALEMLREQQNNEKAHSKTYTDHNLVFAQKNGRPLDKNILTRRFTQHVKDNNLPKVVFHSLRHMSITYKLIFHNGNMKAVQGDTGHAYLSTIGDIYAHTIDSDRKRIAEIIENEVYQNKNKKSS